MKITKSTIYLSLSLSLLYRKHVRKKIKKSKSIKNYYLIQTIIQWWKFKSIPSPEPCPCCWSSGSSLLPLHQFKAPKQLPIMAMASVPNTNEDDKKKFNGLGKQWSKLEILPTTCSLQSYINMGFSQHGLNHCETQNHTLNLQTDGGVKTLKFYFFYLHTEKDHQKLDSL